MTTRTDWWNDPARIKRQIEIARQILVSQGGKCAECGEPLEFEDATKRSHSFDVICKPCLNKPQATVFTLSEVDKL